MCRADPEDREAVEKVIAVSYSTFFYHCVRREDPEKVIAVSHSSLSYSSLFYHSVCCADPEDREAVEKVIAERKRAEEERAALGTDATKAGKKHDWTHHFTKQEAATKAAGGPARPAPRSIPKNAAKPVPVVAPRTQKAVTPRGGSGGCNSPPVRVRRNSMSGETPRATATRALFTSPLRSSLCPTTTPAQMHTHMLAQHAGVGQSGLDARAQVAHAHASQQGQVRDVVTGFTPAQPVRVIKREPRSPSPAFYASTPADMYTDAFMTQHDDFKQDFKLQGNRPSSSSRMSQQMSQHMSTQQMSQQRMSQHMSQHAQQMALPGFDDEDEYCMGNQSVLQTQRRQYETAPEPQALHSRRSTYPCAGAAELPQVIDWEPLTKPSMYTYDVDNRALPQVCKPVFSF